MPPEEKTEEPTVDMTEDGGMKIEESANIEPQSEEPTPPIASVVEPTVGKTEDGSMKIEESNIINETPILNTDKAPDTIQLQEVSPKPMFHDPKYTKDIPQKILDLSPEELNAARLLRAREHIAAAQAQGNRNRRARMNNRMDEIEAIIKAHPKTTTHVVATSMNLSDKTTSGYLQKLVHAGRVQASGNSPNRRYYV